MPLPTPIIESCCLSAPRRCFWVGGVQISYLAGARTNSGDPDITEHFVPPGAGPPFHLHQSRTDAFYVIQGQFRFRCGANDTFITAGQFLMLPQGLPHLYENVGEEWGRLLNVITPGGLEPLYLELDQASRHVPLSFNRFLDITSRHGVAIVTSPPDRGTTGEACPPTVFEDEKSV
jgi:mannose-6-phosphate isomerase-like protein (cupin superfamily)